ncbi:hypothetical protein QYE76_071311 [Lolium multiflorum]|uniref:Transposase (putative) gypsy type domain-containing protein n=1 Tax=Lolium multiflorum TaxID=4521 RepID=A0AAD8WEH5_LOLMU|nr:hypothetical protein QYE76_071311 [Lolium multiflorum]
MWKKKSIFWELEYWKVLEVRSAIDVMHVTKNICVNILSFLSVYGKSNDTKEAQQDQQSLKDPDEHLEWFQGRASYALTKEEKVIFFECLSGMKSFTPLRLRRSPSAVARSSSGARRTHAVPPPDFAVRRSSAATSSRPPHLCFFASFSASPSTVLAGGCRPASPPANSFPSDRAAQDLHAGFESGISVSPPTLAMSDEESSSASSSSLSLKRRRPSPGESTASDPMETDSGNQQESGFRKEFPVGFRMTRSNRIRKTTSLLFFLLTLSVASAFLPLLFWEFLDFYELQPHHLPGNAIFYLSCYATFMEAYIGIRPTCETFARFFNLRINSVQGKEIPKPKPPVQCGSCIVGSRQGSTFLKFTGLESCRTWQGTFFYVKNTGRADHINLPPYQEGPPSRANWSYNPKTEHAETNRVVRFLASLKKETNICPDDVIRTFISRRVLPLKRRAHRMSEMYGPGDPTKITGRALSKKDVVLKAKQICQTAMPFTWEWGLLPLSSSNRPTQEARDRFPSIQAEPRGPLRKRAFDSFDPDPYIFWKDLKMGKTPAARLGRDPPEPTGNPEELVVLEIHERVPPLRRGDASLWTNLMARGRAFNGRHLPAPAHAPPSQRSDGAPPLSSLPQGHRALRDPQGPHPSSSLKPGTIWCREHQDTGASNTGAGEEEAAGRAEPFAPPVLEKTTSAPESSAPEGSKTGDAPSAPPSPRTILMPPPEAPRAQPSKAAPGAPPAKTSGASSTAPPPKPSKLIKGKATASSAPSGGQQPLVLHVSKAAKSASMKATGLLGRITEFQRQGRDLGHLLPYAQKWNAADITPATRGMGKDRLPDPVTADTRKALFEELLWEHRELAEAHDKCQVIPEASIDALKEQLATAQREKDELSRQHQEELNALKTSYQELKSQLIQLGLDHAKALKAAEVTAAAKLDEALEDACNATVVLRAELEEMAKARKGAEEKAARLEEGHKECDQLILQTDTLALRKLFSFTL